MLATTYRALAPVLQFLTACFRMLFHYPIIVLQTLYCFVEAMSVKTHLIIVECLIVLFMFLFFGLALICTITNDRDEASAKKTRDQELLLREDQHNRHVAEKEKQHRRHVADKEECHFRQVEEIEICEDIIAGIVSDSIKNDQIHATLLKKLSELVTLQELDQAIERHMKVVSGSSRPALGAYPAISETMAAFSQDIGVLMQLQINEVVARRYEQLKTSPPLSFSAIQSQETTSTPPTSQKGSLSTSSVSSAETTPMSPPENKLSSSDVVAQDTTPPSAEKHVLSLSSVSTQDTTPIAPTKPTLSISSVSTQETEPLDVSQAKLTIGTIVSQSTAPEQVQLQKLAMSKIGAVSTCPLEVAPTTLAISDIKTVLEQVPNTISAADDTLYDDYDEYLDQFEQQLEEQGAQELVADIVTTPITAGLDATVAPFAPVLPLPDISVPTQAHVTAAVEEPVKALPLPPSVEKKAATPPATGLFSSSFASGVSLKPPKVPVPVQAPIETEAKASTPTPSTPKIKEVTKTAETGTYCDVCDVMVTTSMKKHAEEYHGYCMICRQMVSGEWADNRFTYEKHKELCRTTFKPKLEVKIPATPKPTTSTSKTPVRTAKPATTPATNETTKTFVCRHCHEEVIAPIITTREGHQIGNFSEHNITCRSVRTYVKFYCVNCGMGVTNTDQFHAEHREACQKEASKIGNFRAFDKKTGLRIGESTEGLPPMAPRAMMGRTDGSRVSKAPVKGATPKGPQATREVPAHRGFGSASSSPAQPQWQGNVIKY